MPTSTIVNDQVVFDWAAPADNGTPITAYNVYFRQSDDTYSTETVYCDGSDSLIVSTTTCTVPLSTLRAAPFGLADLGSAINIRVNALNAYGTSPLSEMGSGAIMQLVPDAPINLANVPEITLDDKIGLSWEDGASNGGTSIVDYQIYFDQGSDSYVELISALTQREYIATSLFSATTYAFKVRARNTVGYGPFSSEVQVLAA